MEQQTHPMALGSLLLSIRTRLGLSKYKIEQVAGKVRPLNHVLIERIETGKRVAPDYETIWRIAEAMDESLLGTARDGAFGHGDRLALFEAAAADRVTYEMAKFAVYYLFLLGEGRDELDPALDDLREDIIAAFPETGRDAPRRRLTERATGRTATRGARHDHVNLRTATGFALVRGMAELKEAHPLRLGLLINVVPWIMQDWEGETLLLGRGRHAAAPPSPDDRSNGEGRQYPRVERNGSTDHRIVPLWTPRTPE